MPTSLHQSGGNFMTPWVFILSKWHMWGLLESSGEIGTVWRYRSREEGLLGCPEAIGAGEPPLRFLSTCLVLDLARQMQLVDLRTRKEETIWGATLCPGDLPWELALGSHHVCKGGQSNPSPASGVTSCLEGAWPGVSGWMTRPCGCGQAGQW